MRAGGSLTERIWPLEVVRAEQIFAVLDEVAIAVFAIAQRPLDAAAFVDFRLQHRVLVEGLRAGRGGSLRALASTA